MPPEDPTPAPLDYARPRRDAGGAHRRSLNKWGWAAIFAGCGVAVAAFAGLLICSSGWVSDEAFDRILVIGGALFLLGAATCVAGIALCAVAASRNA